MKRPTLYLTTFTSPPFYGPGNRLTIMVRPRLFERGFGRVSALLPNALDLEDIQKERITVAEYRRRYEARLDLETGGGQNHLEPGHLLWWGGTPETSALVKDGDTLTCGGRCTPAVAARGECHRAWAAPYLIAAGWEVVLDGAPYRPPLGGLFSAVQRT